MDVFIFTFINTKNNAVKVVDFFFFGFWQLKKEISAMKLINHPNVVKIFEVPYCAVFLFFLTRIF